MRRVGCRSRIAGEEGGTAGLRFTVGTETLGGEHIGDGGEAVRGLCCGDVVDVGGVGEV